MCMYCETNNSKADVIKSKTIFRPVSQATPTVLTVLFFYSNFVKFYLINVFNFQYLRFESEETMFLIQL